MKIGDLVKVIKNDMSLVIKFPIKDNLFISQFGTIIHVYDRKKLETFYSWYGVIFPAGYYEAREDALEVISHPK